MCIAALSFPFGFPDVLEGEIFLQNLPSIVAAHALGTYIAVSSLIFLSTWSYGWGEGVGSISDLQMD